MEQARGASRPRSISLKSSPEKTVSSPEKPLELMSASGSAPLPAGAGNTELVRIHSGLVAVALAGSKEISTRVIPFQREESPAHAISVSARMRARRTCSRFVGSSRSVVALISKPPLAVRSVRISGADVRPAACWADR
jgi:hypothetical protein